MSHQSHGSSKLGSSDLEEDYPCITGPSGTRNLPHAYTPEHQLCTGREGFSVQSRYINTNFGSSEDIAPQPHPYEGYKYEHKRIETYNDWPSNAAVKSSDLARNGFIYLHINDRVQCAFCRGILSNWEAGDVIEVEHKKHCPECPFAFGYECGNIPLNQSNNEQGSIFGQPATQFVTPHSRIPQSVPQHGNFSFTSSQPNPQFNYPQPSFFQRPTQQINPAHQAIPSPALQPTPVPQQIPQPQRNLQTIHVRPETNAQVSFNRHSGSLNIYGGNVTLTAGNQEDAVGSMPSLPVPSRPAVNTETIIASPKYPKWENELVRLKSYTGWPAQISQKPRELAMAGLLYLGSGDRVKCYWCGGELHDWEPQDNPMEEHAKWFTMCGYVRMVMGDDYIQKVRDKQNGLIDEVPQVSDIFSHPHVLAVLQHGYTREQIQSAFDHYGKEKLYNAHSLMNAIEFNKPQQHRLQSVESTSEKASPLLASDTTGTNKFSGLNHTVWSQSKAMDEGTGEDIAPFWLEAKKKELNSPGEDEGIVIDDVEMEDTECKNDQSITTTKDTTENTNETEDKQPKDNQSKELPESSKTAREKLGQVINMKNKKDIDPVELENEKLKDQKLCKICMDKELAITFLPCGHLATCEECSKSLSECPICRKHITNTVKVFWS